MKSGNTKTGVITIKIVFKRMYCFFSSLILITMGICAAVQYISPSEMTVSPGEGSLYNGFPLSVSYNNVFEAADTGQDDSADAKIMLFSAIPVKNVRVTFSDRQYVRIGGEPFGIRLYTEGLVISQITEVDTESGKRSPAMSAGLKSGDIIIAVNGDKLRTSEQLTEAVKNSEGSQILLTVVRNESVFTAEVIPVRESVSSAYRLGLWVRDSVAGIGTMTFTDENNHRFAGLGHGICDSTSGQLMPLSEGDIVPASIVSVEKGKAGSPGALNGCFTGDRAIGTIEKNDQCGLYGKLDSICSTGELLPVANKQEALRGKAKIRTTVCGNSAEYYDVEIEEISYNNKNITKNMVIHITDERLLSITGGIVQGMSGSPVVQEGRLVGAITHVFVNDPTRGYAIFAENMSDLNSQIIQKSSG